MRLFLIGVVCVSVCFACAPGKLGADETGGSEASSTGSESTTSSETETGTETETTGDGDDEPDLCPADPELGANEMLLDGDDYAIDFREFDGRIEWTHSCTVTSHSGALAASETIELGCVDAEGQDVAHTIELLFEVDGVPLAAPVTVGQQVELSLWVEVWFSGTAAWTLRDADEQLLLLHYNGPYLPEAGQDEFAPFPEFLAPLSVDVDTRVCPYVCEEDSSGVFVPSDGCCVKETALVFDLGSGPAEILHASGGVIPGPAGAYAVVRGSTLTDISTCTASDISSEFYKFAVVAGS